MCGVCVVYVWCVWCMCGVCVVYVRFMCGVCVVCVCGVCVVYVVCVCGVCVVSGHKLTKPSAPSRVCTILFIVEGFWVIKCHHVGDVRKRPISSGSGQL